MGQSIDRECTADGCRRRQYAKGLCEPCYRRARRRRQEEEVANVLEFDHGDPIDRLLAWSRNTLRVPAGHRLAGEPMEVPAYALQFLRDATAAGVRESLLTMARKNAKSAIVAVLLLGFLAGPLRRPGWRAGVVSVNKAKAAELMRQMREIAEASDLEGLTFYRSPAPGRVEGTTGTLDVLSSDSHAGAASGYDLAVVDELGLLGEKDRELLSGLKSSTSARDGQFMAISIVGNGLYVGEMLERRNDPSVVVHAYIPPADADPLDPATWAIGNPGLGTVKSASYMQDRARLVANNPTDSRLFASEDCNILGDPTVDPIVSVTQYLQVLEREPERQPPRKGPAYTAVDAGGSSSMTCVVAGWPDSGRVEIHGAFPGVPDLLTRGRADGVGRKYEELADRGQLRTYPDRVSTPVVLLLRDVLQDLRGVRVLGLGADRYRHTDLQDYLSDAGVTWPIVWRGTGAHAVADGSADVMAFQKMVLDQTATVCVGMDLLSMAISESVIRYDGAGNAALDKSRRRGRIDALQAAVILAGLVERHRAANRRPKRKLRVMLAG